MATNTTTGKQLLLASHGNIQWKTTKDKTVFRSRSQGFSLTSPGKAHLRFGKPLFAAISDEKPPTSSDSVPDLKSMLLDALVGTERGLTARGETKARINELIVQLESQNPTPSPTATMELLNGAWKLIYTSNPAQLAMLGLDRLPLVKIGDITQKIDSLTMTAENQVQITVPFSRTSFSTTASLEVRSPSRLQVKFEEGIIRSPELLEDIEFPSTISVLGQTIDVSNVAEALKPFQSSFRDAVAQLGNFISQQPDLKIPLPKSERSQSWVLTTYLDADTRIMRGSRGVYVLVKDISISETKPIEVPIEDIDQPEPDLSIESDT